MGGWEFDFEERKFCEEYEETKIETKNETKNEMKNERTKNEGIKMREVFCENLWTSMSHDSSGLLSNDASLLLVIHFKIIYVWETRSQAHHLSRLAALATWHSRRRWDPQLSRCQYGRIILSYLLNHTHTHTHTPFSADSLQVSNLLITQFSISTPI